MRRHYTIKEKMFIEENLNRLTTTEIGEALGRNRQSIRNFLSRNGLNRNPETARQMSLQSLRKGQGWNKGKKGYMGANRTSFKKGEAPYNTKHDGAISIRTDKNGTQYKHIRVSQGKWEYLHRHNWKQHRDLPKGMIVAFKDGDTMNCEIGNLELITRAENMKRNQNRKKAAESMKKTWEDTKLAHIYGLTPKGKWKNTKRAAKHKGEVKAITEAFADFSRLIG